MILGSVPVHVIDAMLAKAREQHLDLDRLLFDCESTDREWRFAIEGEVLWTTAREIAMAGQFADVAAAGRVFITFENASWDGRICRVTGDPGPAWSGAAPVYPTTPERVS